MSLSGWPGRALRTITVNRIGIFAATISLVSAVSFAGPPFRTDDPEPVELGHWEFYLATTYEHTQDGNDATLPMAEVNYGALPDVQLHAVAPMTLSDPKDGSREYGYGDTELGVKYRFIQETPTIPMVGIFPLVELPTGSESRGLGNGRTQLFLPLWLQKSFDDDKWTTYGGGGYWFNNAEGAKDHWFFGWELQRKITDKLTLGGELFYQTSDADGAGPHTGFNVGVIYDVTEHHHLLFSVGRDIIGDVRFSSYLGYQFTF